MKKIENLQPCCLRHQILLREPVRSGTYIPAQEVQFGAFEHSCHQKFRSGTRKVKANFEKKGFTCRTFRIRN